MMDIKSSVSLKSYNTFGLEAAAEFFAVAKNSANLANLLSYAKEKSLPVIILGGGSNVLIQADIPGLVIRNEILGIEYKEVGSEVEVIVGAGVMLDDLVAETVAKGYWGLENLSHIPGTVGATPVQNVGAYGVEVSGLIKEVEVLDKISCKTQVYSNDECQFSYRNSVFKTSEGKDKIVTNVTFLLSMLPKPQLEYSGLHTKLEPENPTQQEIRNLIVSIRSGKFPDWTKVGTAGSFFKNPIIGNEQYQKLKNKYPDLPGFSSGDGLVKIPLAWILEHVCNLRNYREGEVGTYEGQALVVVNYGNATADQIKNFAEDIAQKVLEKTEINIEWEVTKLG